MKKNRQTDITQSVISSQDLRILVNKIFPDSIILDKDFNVFSVSNCISKALGYKDDMLKHKPLSQILSCPDMVFTIKEKLKSGYFEKYQVDLKHVDGSDVLYKVSGFYLGLISDLNDLIVLKLKNLEEIKNAHNLLEAKSIEMDDFVYHAAHSLRGPLATLKGLINLAQLTDQKTEMDILTSKMNLFAQRLDDKLSKLVNFAESGNEKEMSPSSITIAKLGEKLKLAILEDKSGPSLIFKESYRDNETEITEGETVFSALNNIISFFIQQRRSKGSELLLGSSSNNAFVEFEIRTRGISVNQDQKLKIEKMIFGYVEILNEPEFASLYAAKKIISKLNGRISLSFQNTDEACVYIIIPREFCNQHDMETRLNVYHIFQTLM